MVSIEGQVRLDGLLRDHGRVVLNDPADLEAKVFAVVADHKEAGLLILALKAGVPQALVAGSSTGDELAKKLQDENFIALESAQSAVQAWATALGSSVTFAGSAPSALSPPIAIPPIHDGPPLPHVEVVEPPSMQWLQPSAPSMTANVPRPAPNSSNATAIVLIVICAVVVIVGGLGFLAWKKSQDLAVSGLGVNKPLVTSLTPGNTGATTSQTTGSTGLTTTTTGSSTSGTTGSRPVLGDTAGGSDDPDMLAYNAKLADARRLFDQATETFKQQNGTLSSADDENKAMDEAAPMWDTYSQSLAQVAANLDAITPPAEAAAIHRQLTSFVSQYSAMVADGAADARAHDSAAFQSNGNKAKDFGTASGQQLASLITAAGFDLDQYQRDGTLVKKK